MTSDEARELFSEVWDGELDPDRRVAFEAAVAADPELRAEWEGFRAMLEEAHSLAAEDPAEGPTPDLLSGVQKRLRECSRGRFYRDRFSTRATTARAAIPILLGLVMLVVIVVAWIMMNVVDVRAPSVTPDGTTPPQTEGG